MSRFPETRISLILRLAAADDVEAWREFAVVYAPAVYALARSRGLQAADAEDFVQELLLAVAQAAGRWRPDSSRASFRTWLFRVARNLFVDHYQSVRRTATHAVGGEDLAVDELAATSCAESELEQLFELEYRRALFHRAACLVRKRVEELTWAAFQATAIDAIPAATASSQLGLSIGSVYVARSRVMKMLRSEIERLETEHGQAPTHRTLQEGGQS
ncbi:MAG: RNA polymerase sigma factor [Aureliella sp.]